MISHLSAALLLVRRLLMHYASVLRHASTGSLSVNVWSIKWKPGRPVAHWPVQSGTSIHHRRHAAHCRQRSSSVPISDWQGVPRSTHIQLWWLKFRGSMRDSLPVSSLAGHELQAIQPPTEYISVRELVHHGMLWLSVLLCLRRPLTYLLTPRSIWLMPVTLTHHCAI